MFHVEFITYFFIDYNNGHWPLVNVHILERVGGYSACRGVKGEVRRI